MIESPQNEKLKLVRKLHERKHREREDAFLSEGEDLLAAGLAAGVEPRFVLVAAGSGLGGGGVVRRGFLVADEPTLRQVAATTGGTYFSANDAGQLKDVLEALPHHVKVQHRTIEVSVALAGFAALLILVSVWAASRWSAFPT